MSEELAILELAEYYSCMDTSADEDAIAYGESE